MASGSISVRAALFILDMMEQAVKEAEARGEDGFASADDFVGKVLACAIAARSADPSLPQVGENDIRFVFSGVALA